MTEAEVIGFDTADGDPLLWRIAMHPDIPMTLREVHDAPVSLILQAEVMLAHHDRVERRKRLIRDHYRRKGARRGR